MKKNLVLVVVALCFAITAFGQKTKKQPVMTIQFNEAISFEKLYKFIEKLGVSSDQPIGVDDTITVPISLYCWTVPGEDILAAGAVNQKGKGKYIYVGAADVAGSSADYASDSEETDFIVYPNGKIETSSNNPVTKIEDVRKVSIYLKQLNDAREEYALLSEKRKKK